MSEPPALPEPIKPPRGDFSLEERKWREGITRAINILTEEIGHIATTGDLDGDSYISVNGGTDAVLGSGASLSFNDTNLAKLNGANTFSNYNTFSNGLSASSIDLNGSDLATSLNNLSSAIAGKADSFTKGNLSSGSNSYISVSGGSGAVIGSGATISFTDTNLAKLNANNNFTGATNTFQGISLGGNIIPSTNKTSTLGDTSHGLKSIHFGNNNSEHPDNGDWGIYCDNGYLPLTGKGGSYGGILIYGRVPSGGTYPIQLFSLTSQGIIPAQTNMSCGLSSNYWQYVYTKNITLDNCAIYHATDTNDIQIGWTSGGARAVYFTGVSCRPYTDNTIYLGVANAKWKAVYSNTGTIQTSDAEQKENLNKVESGLKTLNSLNVYSFNWKGDEAKRGEEKNTFYGIVAQEALEKAPELVDVPTDYQKGEGTLGVYVSNVLFLAVRAIQELSEKISKLEESYGNNTKDR